MAKVNVKLNGLKDAVLAKITQAKLNEAAIIAAKEMDRVKNEQTKRFKSPAKGGTWVNTYNAKYAKSQKKGINTVNLRRNKPKSNSMEKTTINVIGKKAVISFQDAKKGVIFNYHHKGTATGRKKRQIYPTNLAQVPDSVIKKAMEFLSK